MFNNTTHCNKIFSIQTGNYLPLVNQKIIGKELFKECQVLSIIKHSYILVHHKGQLFLIDQHAASQKLLYMQGIQSTKKKKQSFVCLPKTYMIPRIYQNLLVQNSVWINQLGWQYKIQRQNGMFVVIQISKEPGFYKDTLRQDELIQYLEKIYISQEKEWDIIRNSLQLTQREKQIIGEYACHKAYKFGDKLLLNQAQSIIRTLADVQGPFNCPHSRILISYYGSAKQLGFI